VTELFRPATILLVSTIRLAVIVYVTPVLYGLLYCVHVIHVVVAFILVDSIVVSLMYYSVYFVCTILFATLFTYFRTCVYVSIYPELVNSPAIVTVSK